MKILIATTVFAPRIGGMETVAALLARGLQKTRHEVTIITTTPKLDRNDNSMQIPYKVIRLPSRCELLRAYRWANAIFLQGLTLRLGWPLLFSKKPCLISHHMILDRDQYSGAIRRLLLKRCRSISVSRAVAGSLPVQSEVIYNPYDSEVFTSEVDSIKRTRNLIFVGHLSCAGKGADLLIKALRLLADQNLRLSLTIVGAGGQRPELEKQVQLFGLKHQVQFAGGMSGEPLAEMLREHEIMVVPSRVKEAFGIVALEGIACGCVVIGSDSGGLPEAIGRCGVTFPSGDAHALAERIHTLLRQPGGMTRYREAARTHLADHNPMVVAQRYISLLGTNGRS